ncbi:MAG: glycosyltransferase [Candidatus Limnocylindria bacterium]
MSTASALDERMHDGIRRIGTADVVVGIPSFRNAATIGHVARAVASGLLGGFPHLKAVIVSSDGGSDDGTTQVVLDTVRDVPVIAGSYRGLPGKGSALRAIFECTSGLGARAGAVVDSDLRSITPQWVQRLLGPVLDGTVDYVTPLYARHKHDGTITNTIAYPLTRALYGVRVRQPIGGEFGFSGELARRFVESGDWSGHIARFGIDIHMTTTALVSGARIAQAFLGAKIHDPKDPGSDLAPMFTQVVATLFDLAGRNAARWRDVTRSRGAPVVGDVEPVEPEVVNASTGTLRAKHAAGSDEHGAMWDEVLGRAPDALDAREWARIVYAFLAAALRDPARRDRLVQALVPLYFGRVARFIDDAADLSTTESERLVEDQAAAFEEEKGSLRERLA